MVRGLALLVALAAAALIAWAELRLPSPAPADAPEASFSATRAMADVRRLAAVPHPIGSAGNHLVRDRLRARMEDDLDLATRLRHDDTAFPARGGGGVEGGSPETLIGVLPGRDRNAAPLALMAHYDSVPGAPGAADDFAGVSTALEVVRAIAAKGAPAHDVVLILTDGEEAGLLGGRGVFAHDPLARRLGLVINLEARGSGGRTLMFETGARNGGMIGLFRKAAVRPLTGSLFGAVYAFLPNDTDLTPARAAGRQGFNFAFAGREFDYHSPTDTPANLQPGALQDMGAQTLSLASAAAFAPSLPPAEADAVFGALFGDTLLAYPQAVGWLVLLAAAALIALGLVRARRLVPLSWAEAARGAGAGLYMLTGAAAVLRLAGAAAVVGTGALGPTRLLAQAGRWEAALLLLALGFWLFAAAQVARERRAASIAVPLIAGLAACALTRNLDPVGLGAGVVAAGLALALGGRPVSRPAGWAGVLLLGLAVGVVLQIAAPLTAYVVAWPLLAGALACAITGMAADRSPGPRTALVLIAALALGWIGVQAHLFVVVVVGLPELLCLPLLLAALVAWPLAQPAPAPAATAQAPGRLLLLAGAVLVLLVRLESPWDARHPQPTFVAYQLDQDAGRAWRIADPELRTAWSDGVLKAEGGAIVPFDHWAWSAPMIAAPARLAAIPAPVFSAAHWPGGLVAVKVTPPPGARTLALQLMPQRPAQLAGVGSAALDQPLPPGRWTRLRWSAPNADGLILLLRAAGPGRLQIRYAAGFQRWPAGVAPPMAPPADVMATGVSGEARVTGTRTLAW